MGGGGDCHDFPSVSFCRRVPKGLVAESFSVPLFPGIQKIYALERSVMICWSKFFVSQYQENS